jgi:molybdopterin-guanine dinucleotide biosynthesis protein A
MVVSCYLPYLNSAVLNLIIRASLSESVVPVSNGKKQPLCAKWSVHDLLRAKTKFLEGERSLKWFPSEDAVLLDSEFEFKECGGEENFKDIDTTDDFNQLIKDYEDGRFDFLGRDLYPPRNVNCGTDPIDLILEVNCSAGGPTS